MVTTVTVTTIAAMGLAASLCVFGVILLIGLLVGKELLGASNANGKKVLARTITVSIVPLLVSFTVIVALKVVEILG